VLRVVIQCMLPGTPQELSAEAEILAKKVTSSFPPVEHEGVSDGELCPACGVEVPLTDIAEAICSNGHRWCKFMIKSDAPRYADGSPNPLLLPLAVFLHQPAVLSHPSFSRPRWCKPA
jgi:general transcription factor 3C polypeptide 4